MTCFYHVNALIIKMNAYNEHTAGHCAEVIKMQTTSYVHEDVITFLTLLHYERLIKPISILWRS